MQARARARALSYIYVAALVGCGDDEPPPPPPPTFEYELFETTKELDADTLSAISAIDETGASVTFTRMTPQLSAVRPNDVLLSGATDKTPRGLLLQVVGVEPMGTGAIVRTQPATVFHAFRRFDLRMERQPIGAGAMELPSRAPPTPEGAVAPTRAPLTLPLPLGNPSFDKPLFDGDGIATSDEDRVGAKGKMVETVTVTFWLKFDWGSLSPTEAFSALGNLLEDLTGLFSGDPPDLGDLLHLDTGLHIDGSVDVLLDVAGSSALSFDRTYNLNTWVLGVITVGPLVFVPTVTLDAHFEGGVGGHLTTSFGLGSDFGLGFGYSDGSITPYKAGPTFTHTNPTTTTTAAAELRAELALRLNLQMYGFFGPYAGITAYGDLAMDRFATPCWRFTAGLEGEVGASLGIFGRTLKNIVGPKFPLGDPVALGEGACEPIPDPAPTDQLITPWSRSFADTGSIGTDEDFTNVELSHDNRLLITAGVGDVMMKVDQAGALTWARTFEQPDRPDFAGLDPQHAVATADTGILVATEQFVLVKLDQGGTLEWAAQLETDNGTDGFWEMKRVGDEVWLGGAYSVPTMTERQAWLVGLAPDGSVKWSWTWGVPGLRESVREILALDDGALVVGESGSGAGGFLWRMNADGTIRWAKHVDGCAGEDLVLATAIHTMDDNFVVGGWFYATDTHALLFRISPAGTETSPEWATRTSVPELILGPMIRSIHQLPTGELRVVGRYARTGPNGVFVAGTDSIGRFAWLQLYDSSSNPPSSFITDQGGLLIAAITGSFEPDLSGFWTFEVPAPNGTMDFATGVVRTPLTPMSEAACLTIVDAPVATTPMPLPMTLVDVNANEAMPAVRTQ